MKIRIIPPSKLDVASVDHVNDGIEVEPIVLRQQNAVRVLYLEAVGDGGVVKKSIVLFNTNTGTFSVQSVDEQRVVPAFDRAPAEFNTRVETVRAKSRNRSTVREEVKDVVPT